MSKNLYDLREMLCEELDEYNRDAKNGMNAGHPEQYVIRGGRQAWTSWKSMNTSAS